MVTIKIHERTNKNIFLHIKHCFIYLLIFIIFSITFSLTEFMFCDPKRYFSNHGCRLQALM